VSEVRRIVFRSPIILLHWVSPNGCWGRPLPGEEQFLADRVPNDHSKRAGLIWTRGLSRGYRRGPELGLGQNAQQIAGSILVETWCCRDDQCADRQGIGAGALERAIARCGGSARPAPIVQAAR